MTDFPHPRIGARIRFADERRSYTVRAVSTDGRFLICTKRNSLPKIGLIYTIVDQQLGVRGADNFHGLGYSTEREVDLVMGRLQAGEVEVSHRNWTWLVLHARQVDKEVAALVPAMLERFLAAPAHRYNEAYVGAKPEAWPGVTAAAPAAP